MPDNGRPPNLPQHFQPPQQPQRLGAIARAFAVAKMLAGGGIFLGLLVVVGDKILAPEYKPSVLIGGFAGNTESAETRAKQSAAIEFMRLQAEANAYAQARAQMEAEAFRKQQEKLGETQNVESTLAQLGDLACLVGQLIPSDARDAETRGWGQGLRTTCGFGDQMRDTMTQQLARAGRNGSAIIPRTGPAPQEGPTYKYVP